MSKFQWLKDELAAIEAESLLRKPICIDSAQGVKVNVGGSEKVLFCSNNYLNLACDQRIISAATDAMAKFGYGSAASRLISGTMAPHVELEKKLAELFGKESSLVFSSGFVANEALIKTLPGKGDLLLLDKLDHASIMSASSDSDATFRTFHRGQYEKAERFLVSDKFNRRFIITESIFSMDGDLAELEKLVELRNKYDAILIVDEAHAFGCMGKNGAGMADEMGLLSDVDIIVGTLSKAAGCVGGFLAGNKCVTDYIVNKAKEFIYTTAPAVVNCAAAMTAIDIFKAEPQRQERLRENAAYLRNKLIKIGCDIGQSQSHVVPVIIGDNQRTVDISAKLFGAGFVVVAIRPPTVLPGTARLRISLQCDHTKEQIDELCDALKKILNET